MDKKYKPYLVKLLFVLCIILAISQIHLIKGDLDLILNDEIVYNNIEHNNLYYIDLQPTNQKTPEVTKQTIYIIYKSIWRLIDMILYLFMGGMIYARNREIIEK